MSKALRSQETTVVVLTDMLFIAASAGISGSFTRGNLLGLLKSVQVLCLLSLGVGIVVIDRGIDFSMIAVTALPVGLILDMVARGQGIGVSLSTGFSIALAVCLINAYLIAYAGLPALLVTLETGIGLCWIFLSRARVGRVIYAIGDNPAAARTVGIPTKLVSLQIYVISALLAFATELTSAANLGTTSVRIYDSTTLYDVILIVVLGGFALSGGRGSVLSAIRGHTAHRYAQQHYDAAECRLHCPAIGEGSTAACSYHTRFSLKSAE